MKSRHAALAAVFLGAAACDAALGIREYPGATESGEAGASQGGGADEGGPGCGLSVGDGPCAACVQSSCCPQAEACAANGSCSEYENCALGCGADYACKSRCVIADYGTAPEISALDTCVAVSCAGACGLKCGMTTSIAEPDAAAGCVQCLVNAASPQVQACTTSLACQELQQQGFECPTEDCAEALAEGNEAGATLLAEYLLTSQEACAGACSFGSYWDCAASSPGLIPSSQAITLVFDVVPTNAALNGATVKACTSDDVQCASPIVAPQKTDEGGAVTFVLPGVSDVYFDVSLPGTIYPTLYFFQHAFTVPKVTLNGLLVAAPSVIEDFYSTYGVAPDATKGTIEIQSVDCHWYPAADTTATANFGDGGLPFAYFVNDQLTPSATSTAPSGFAVLLNTQVTRPATVSVTPRAVGRVLGTGAMFARAGAISFMTVGAK